MKKTLEDSAKDKKVIEHADLEKKAAENFAKTVSGESDTSEETTDDKLASTIG